MPERTEIRPGTYQDSVVLMQISDRARRVKGIGDCVVAMATDLNLALLAEMGFALKGVESAATSDMVVAIRGTDETSVQTASELIDAALLETRHGHLDVAAPPTEHPRAKHATLRTTVAAASANLAVISVPGAHVVPEAVDAVLGGANLMIFSDGVSIEHERRLKALADERGLLVMGPDCGTALIGGVGLGFVNEVTHGDIGIVAASGTGAQHLMCLLHASGAGISHVLGVGGRDLRDEIGGVSTMRAMRMLDADPATAHIVVVSKPPGPQSAKRIAGLVADMQTPVTLGILGAGTSLTSVAAAVATATGRTLAEPFKHVHDQAWRPATLAGLFCGGSLSIEAVDVLSAWSEEIGSIASLSRTPTPEAIASRDTHFLVDLGDDRFTVGRPHPMIDPSIRRHLIKQLAKRSQDRHLFLDVVLGRSAHADPAGALAPSLAAFLGSHPHSSAVVSLVGSDRDSQNLLRQRDALIEVGCDVFASNAEAAEEVGRRLLPPAGSGNGRGS